MKVVVRKLFAAVAVAIGLVSPSFGASVDFAANAMSKANGFTGGTLSGRVLTVADGSQLQYLPEQSKKDDLNRKQAGWYAGVTIQWPADQASYLLPDIDQTREFSVADTLVGADCLTHTTTGSGIYKHFATTTWWVWITAEEAYEAQKADFTQTLTLTGKKASGTTVNETDFSVKIPTSNLVLRDNDGVKWFPAVAIIEKKVYGEIEKAFEVSKTVTAVGDVEVTKTLELGSGVVFKLDGHKLSVAQGGKLVINGGSYDFDPKDYLAKGYGANKDAGTGMWNVVQVHTHSWNFQIHNFNTLTATCENVEIDCTIPTRRVGMAIKVVDKIHDGKEISPMLDNTNDFVKATGVSIGKVVFKDLQGTQLAGAPKNAGTYDAFLVVQPGAGDGFTLSKRFTISPVDASAATVTLDKTSVMQTGSEISVSVTSVEFGGKTLTVGTDYTVSGDLAKTEPGDYTVTINFIGNYSKTASANWSILAPTGEFTAGAAAKKDDGAEYGTMEGTVLTITNAKNLIYVNDKDGKRWQAGMTVTWPRKVTMGQVTTWVPLKVQYVDEAHARVMVDTKVSSYEHKTVEDTYYKSITDWTHEYTYVSNTTWTVSITQKLLDDGVADKDGYINFTATMGSYAWGDETEGCTSGVKDTTFTIRIKKDTELEEGYNLSDAEITLDENSFDYDFSEKSVAIESVTRKGNPLTQGTHYTVDESSVFAAIGNGKTNDTFTVKIVGAGDYKGDKSVTWTIKAPETKLEDNSATAGGTLNGTTLTMNSGKNYGWTYYAAEDAPDGSGEAGFYAGIKVKWPLTVLEKRYTKLEYAFARLEDGEWADGNAIKDGTLTGVTCESGLFDVFNYVTSITWWKRLSTKDLDDAVKAGKTSVTSKMSAIGLTWSGKVAGDTKGVKETDFEIVTTVDENLKLYDDDGFLVWPSHDHEWNWELSEEKDALSATCDIQGCLYNSKSVKMSIAAESAAEKYCDKLPIKAQIVGGTSFAEATGATVGNLVYRKGATDLEEAPAEIGTYYARCMVVSSDEVVTNTLSLKLEIKAGQAIVDGVHVGDAAEYLEKATKDQMDISAGMNFTASKTFVVPESYKEEDPQEIAYTIKDFIKSVFNGEFGDLYTKQDITNLITGKVTLKELLERLPNPIEIIVRECGIKTFDLAGFELTAAKDSEFFDNCGALTLMDSSEAKTGAIRGNAANTQDVDLMVNSGTLSIEGGTYVGTINNEGSLFVSGGTINGEIVNSEDGAVVLTGGKFRYEPEDGWVMAGYDVVKRDGWYYVEKHEHDYVFVPVLKSTMSCTCKHIFVEDPDQLIQLSNCGAREILICIGVQDPTLKFLPRQSLPYTGAEIPANVVAYNLEGFKEMGLDATQRTKIINLIKDMISAQQEWDSKTFLEKISAIVGFTVTLEDMREGIGYYIWDAKRVEEETGLKISEIEYYDRSNGEKLDSAPSTYGEYAAKVVITTPKGNNITRSWNYKIRTIEFSDATVVTNPEGRWFEYDGETKEIKVSSVSLGVTLDTLGDIIKLDQLIKSALVSQEEKKNLLGVKLEYGKDYTIEGTTSASEEGYYSFNVVGIGKYSGSIEIAWSIGDPQGKPTGKLDDDAFWAYDSELGDYATVDGNSAEIDNSLNLVYNDDTAEWEAEFRIDWPYKLNQILKAPTFTNPDDAVITASEGGSFERDGSSFWRIRDMEMQSYLRGIDWKVAFSIEDVKAAKDDGETELQWTIKCSAPVKDDCPEGIVETEFTVTLPLENIELAIDGEVVYPEPSVVVQGATMAELKAKSPETEEVVATVKVLAEDKTYDGSAPDAELEGQDDFEAATRKHVIGPFWRTKDGEELDEAPVMPGEYVVYFQLADASVESEEEEEEEDRLLASLAEPVEDPKLQKDVTIGLIDDGKFHVYFEGGKTALYHTGKEQGPKIWGVYIGKTRLSEVFDYTIGGTKTAAAIGKYMLNVTGIGEYVSHHSEFSWSIIESDRTFDEDAFQVVDHLAYNSITETWDSYITVDWPYSTRQVMALPQYTDVAHANVEISAGTKQLDTGHFFNSRTGKFETYVKQVQWTIPFTPAELTQAYKDGYRAITNKITAGSTAWKHDWQGLATMSWEYVIDLENTKLYDDEGRQCYPILEHAWTFANTEDGALVGLCGNKSCPIGRVEISVAAEDTEYTGEAVTAEIVDVDNQFAIHTYAKIGELVYAPVGGEPIRGKPVEAGSYVATAKVTIGKNEYKIWKQFDITELDISDAAVFTNPDETQFVWKNKEQGISVEAVVVNGILLEKDHDYTVSGDLSAKDVGDYQIVIEGVNSCIGKRTIDWQIVAAIRPFPDDSFDQVAEEGEEYGTLEGNVLTVTASTNLRYDPVTSNWYAGVKVDWPYDTEQILRSPQYTAPELALVRVSTSNEVFTAAQIDDGVTEGLGLETEIGRFWRIRHAQWEYYVKSIGWDVEITLADVRKATALKQENLTYTITVGSPANSNDPDGLVETTFSVVVPLKDLVLVDEEGKQLYPEEETEFAVEPTVISQRIYDGTPKTGVYGGEHVLLTGTCEATEVGTYTAHAIPMAGYTWSDGMSNMKTYYWEIVKVTPPTPVDDLAELKKLFEDYADVEPQEDDYGTRTNILVTLFDDIPHSLAIPGALGLLTIDMNDFDIHGTDGTQKSPNGASGLSLSYGTRLVLVGKGTIWGGNGYSGENPGLGALAVIPEDQIVDCAVTVRLVPGVSGSDGEDGAQELTFATSSMEVREGKDIVLTISGGNLYKPARCQLSVTYNSASKADLVLSDIKFPMSIDWEAGEVGAKTVVIPTKTDSKIEGEESLTFNLSLKEKMIDGQFTSCKVTINDTAIEHDIPCVRAISYPAEIASTFGSDYCDDGERVTLTYRLNRSFTVDGKRKPIKGNVEFLGWYKADALGRCTDEFVTSCKSIVFDRTDKPRASTSTKYVIAGDLSCTTFYAKFKTPNRVIIANPPVDGVTAGTVSGDGYYTSNSVITVKAKAKTGFVFAGWYDDSTIDPIEAEMEGMENALFITKDSSFKMQVVNPVTQLRAVFVTKQEDAENVALAIDGKVLDPTTIADVAVSTGVQVNWEVLKAGLTATTVSAKNLPSGLKLVRDSLTGTYSIVGVPKAKKDDVKIATITVTTAGKTKVSYSVRFSVKALDSWAKGTFNGGSATNSIAITITADAKISGSLYQDGLKWTLTSSGFDSREGDVLAVVLQAKNGSTVKEMPIVLTAEELSDSIRGRIESDSWAAVQNIWNTDPWRAIAAQLSGTAQSYQVEGGMINVQIGKSGSVSAVGNFNGVKALCSTVLLPREVFDAKGESMGYCYDIVIYMTNKSSVLYTGVLVFDEK